MHITKDQFSIIAQALESIKAQQKKQADLYAQAAGQIAKGLTELQASLVVLGKVDASQIAAKLNTEALEALGRASVIAANSTKIYPGAATTLVDISLAVELTGRSRKTIYNAVSSGRLPALKSGNNLLFDRLDLLSYTIKIRQPRNG